MCFIVYFSVIGYIRSQEFSRLVYILSVMSTIVASLLELCCFRNKPVATVASIIEDMEGLAQHEIDKILQHHTHKTCCYC